MPTRHWPRQTRALVVVAHPDDETIWGGGLILRHRPWDWVILSLCRSDDRDRAPKFRRVCDQMDAEAHISDLDDSADLATIVPAREIAPRICEVAAGRTWDLIVTHGRNGEYGHVRHLQIHGEVLRLADEGVLDCRELWTYACACSVPNGRNEPGDWADRRLDLTDEEFEQKLCLVRDVYGYPDGGFEVTACSRTETFAAVRTREP